MKKYIKLLSYLLLSMCFMASCATIVGGSKYNATVTVPSHPNAQIDYNGVFQGTGKAHFKINRKDADKVKITVKEEGCEPQTNAYRGRVFRGWALVGTIFTWTGSFQSNETIIPIPFGLIVDGATGALWKPNPNEVGISKQNYKNYTYQIDYKGCKNNNVTQNQLGNEDLKTQSKAQQLRIMKGLLDSGAITREEYQIEKEKILNQE